MYLSAREIAKKWSMSERRVRILCMTNRIPGVFLSGYQWYVPVDTVRPVDGRLKKAGSLIDIIDGKKEKLDSHRLFTSGDAGYPAEDFAVGNKDAFDFIRKKAEEKQPLTEEFIKQIHSFVLADKKDDRGVYRRIPVRIAGSKTVPVSPALIEAKMKQAVNVYRNGAGHIVPRLARFHLEFETIQPFVDGNGRTGRLITNFELMKAGFPPIDIKLPDQKVYYNAFDAYAEKGAVSAMEDLFARCLNESLDVRLKTLDE